MERKAELERNTKETQINICLNLDGQGEISVNTGFGLLDHMLTLISFWAGFDLLLNCTGDLHVDAHHTAEDVGMMFGKALDLALGERLGIARVGNGRVPMDEALSDVAIDLSGRSWLEWRGEDILPALIAGEERDLWREFYKAIVSTGRLNMHISFLYGKNGHHLLESVAKGLGLALSQAVLCSGNNVRSTKGSLD